MLYNVSVLSPVAFNHAGLSLVFNGDSGSSTSTIDDDSDLPRASSFTHINVDEMTSGKQVEYFFASDAR